MMIATGVGEPPVITKEVVGNPRQGNARSTPVEPGDGVFPEILGLRFEEPEVPD